MSPPHTSESGKHHRPGTIGLSVSLLGVLLIVVPYFIVDATRLLTVLTALGLCCSIAAIILGIVAWQTLTGKTGLVIGTITILALAAILIWLFFIVDWRLT